MFACICMLYFVLYFLRCAPLTIYISFGVFGAFLLLCVFVLYMCTVLLYTILAFLQFSIHYCILFMVGFFLVWLFAFVLTFALFVLYVCHLYLFIRVLVFVMYLNVISIEGSCITKWNKKSGWGEQMDGFSVEEYKWDNLNQPEWFTDLLFLDFPHRRTFRVSLFVAVFTPSSNYSDYMFLSIYLNSLSFYISV